MLQLILCVGSAQRPYSLIHYDENVLPQTSIGNIHQDKDGYLWMSSQFGIVRFDGEKFRVFTMENIPGLTSNRIRLCATAPDKSIYFVDENSVILKLISPNHFEILGIAGYDKPYKAMYTSYSNNDFAFASLGKKLSLRQLNQQLQLDTARELVKTYAIDQSKGYMFYPDLDQKVRLCYYENSRFLSRLLNESFLAQHTFKLSNAVISQTGFNSGIVYKGADTEEKINISGLPAEFSHLFKEDPEVLFSNETGAYLYSGGKLYEYEWREGSLVATLVFDNLPCTDVSNITKERNTGDFLVSTRSNGFYRIKKKQFEVVRMVGPRDVLGSHDTSPYGNMVYSLAFWDARHVFSTGVIVPIDGSGASRSFDPKNKSTLNYYFLYTKDKDHFWINMNSGDRSLLQSFDKNTRQYTALFPVMSPRKVIEFNNGKSVIIATNEIISFQKNQATTMIRSNSTDFTTGEKVTEDQIAVGSSTGISYLFPSSNKLVPVPYKNPLKVRFIFKDKAGRIWFTTYGQGLFHLSGQSIIPIPLDNANHLSIGHHIAEDSNGNFWVSTNHGLFKLSYASLLSIISGRSDKLYYIYFDKSDGFNSNEFNGGSFPSGLYQQETGMLFLPSMDGIVKFNPDSIKSVNINSAIFFDEIEVNDTGKIYQVKNDLKFNNQTSTIAIRFSSPYYGHVENIKFSYALSTAPNKFIDLRGSRNIVLTNLPGGSYSIVVKKEEASTAPVLATLGFTIEKRFTETLLFKLLLLGIVIALVYLYFRARILFLNRERKRLEKEVAVRTADQLNLIDQLKTNIDQLNQLQLELGQMIGHKENVIAVLIHDIKSPLYFLNTVAAHLDKGIEINSQEKNKKIANEISVSLNRLFIFTQDFATWLESSRPGFIQKKEPVDLRNIITQVLTIYEGITEKKGIRSDLRLQVEIVFGDEPMIKSVIRNLIDNAIKNMSAGTLSIVTETVSNDICEITIADQGKGMSENDLAGMNNFFKDPEMTQAFPGNGFGHKVIRDFLLKSGGTISYQQNRPTGVIVRLHLPVKAWSANKSENFAGA